MLQAHTRLIFQFRFLRSAPPSLQSDTVFRRNMGKRKATHRKQVGRRNSSRLAHLRVAHWQAVSACDRALTPLDLSAGR